jgi:hypothetical protein
MTAAAKPFRPTAMPMPASGACNGASTTPPIPPSAAASANTASDIRAGETPDSRAASGSIAVARIAQPDRVRVSHSHSPTITAAVTATIHRYWSFSVMPNGCHAPAVNGRAKCGSVPTSTSATPSMTMDAPIVSMIV